MGEDQQVDGLHAWLCLNTRLGVLVTSGGRGPEVCESHLLSEKKNSSAPLFESTPRPHGGRAGEMHSTSPYRSHVSLGHQRVTPSPPTRAPWFPLF